jgi:hypothetical protein
MRADLCQVAPQDQVTRLAQVFDGGIFDFHTQLLIGVKRRQIVKMNLGARCIWMVKIDRFHFHQSKITLVILWASDVTFHRIACFQAKFLNLRWA